jgi:hypothetical protein
MRSPIVVAAWLALAAAAFGADTPFTKNDVTVDRIAIHGPFNVSKLVIKNPLVLEKKLVRGVTALPLAVRKLEGDDLTTPPTTAVVSKQDIPHVATNEVGEENAIVAKVDPSVLKVLPPSWEVDGASGLQALDMQIAASHSHLVLSSVHTIAFFTKDGTLLDHSSIADFFDLARKDMNDNVLDPATSAKLAAPYQINELYDARVVFDAVRKRFWVGCLARNSEAKYGSEPDHTKHRVTKFALAVSKTENPADGFISYWWDPVYDYPYMGASEKLVVVGLGGEVVAVVADDLANGIATKPYDLKNFKNADDTVASGRLCPALHHGTSSAHFVVATYKSSLSVWGIDESDPSKVYRAGVPVAPFQGPQLAEQQSNGDIPHPHQVNMTNVGNLVMKAVYRDGKLYAVWHDAKLWGGATSPITSLRLTRFDVSAFPDHVAASGTIDRTFGKRNAADPPNTLFHYYWPSLEVNRDGTMVVNYSRSGATIYPELRYSVYRAKDSDIESSQLFQPGEYPLGQDDAKFSTRPDADPVGRQDYAASAVDPQDDRTVWIFNPYAVKASKGNGTYQLKVGRVVIPK